MLLRALRRGGRTPHRGVRRDDIAAVRVLHRAADLQVAVPEQLSVVGYDSSAVALTVRPHLTALTSPAGDGPHRAQMLRERFGRAHDARSIVDPQLIVRASTGPGRPDPGPRTGSAGPGAQMCAVHR